MALSIGIVGAGTMGAGIAHVAALHHCHVQLYDINEEVIRTGVNKITAELKKSVEKNKISDEEMKTALGRIKKRTNINDLDTCDIIIEAVLEDLRVKKDLFKKLDQIAHHTAILATNTSSLSISSIASATRKPERVIGLHFFNPAYTIKLVEVVRGKLTSDSTLQQTLEIVRQIGKKAVVAADSPGFIVNRILRQFYGEAFRLAGEGIASIQEIDRIVRKSGGFKAGPFEQLDSHGIEDDLAIAEAIFERTYRDPRFQPSPLQRQMVEAGLYGKASKKGFYHYDEQK